MINGFRTVRKALRRVGCYRSKSCRVHNEKGPRGYYVWLSCINNGTESGGRQGNFGQFGDVVGTVIILCRHSITTRRDNSTANVVRTRTRSSGKFEIRVRPQGSDSDRRDCRVLLGGERVLEYFSSGCLRKKLECLDKKSPEKVCVDWVEKRRRDSAVFS